MDTRITKKEKTQQEFDNIRSKMFSDGYSEKSCVIPKSLATIVGVVIGVIMTTLVLLLYRAIYGMQPDFVFSTANLLVIAIPSLIVHELLHGIGWVFSCENRWRSIKISFSSLMPLCHCKEPLRRNNYLLGVVFPFLILGVGVSVVALIFGNFTILIAAAINLLITGGDIMIAFALLTSKGGKMFDHPSEAGFVAFLKS